ncbi:hypothetical protein, partial [Paenibacillus sp. Y412MC10]|uniref:hypothetical protein n=1 Tax=Geobacillus sp. (strain Y412MC10) TaxID=481743 RepID=UPI001C92D1E5
MVDRMDKDSRGVMMGGKNDKGDGWVGGELKEERVKENVGVMYEGARNLMKYVGGMERGWVWVY